MNADPFSRKYFATTLSAFPLLLASEISTSLISILGLVLLLMASALISGSEVALFGLNAQDMQWIKAKESKPSERVLHLLESPKSCLQPF